MLKYEFRERRVKIDPLSITMDPLMKIWNEDISSDKHTATKVLTYIHLVSQVEKDAQYFTAAPSEVRSLVKNDLFQNFDHSFGDKEDFLEECIIHYQKAFEEPEFRSIRVLNAKIDEIQEMIDGTPIKITETNVKGVLGYASNFSILKDMMLNITKISKIKEELVASIEKQKAASGSVRIRGDRQMSYLEKKLKERRSKTDMPSTDTHIEGLPDDGYDL